MVVAFSRALRGEIVSIIYKLSIIKKCIKSHGVTIAGNDGGGCGGHRMRGGVGSEGTTSYLRTRGQ